ncbi:MAG TPA: hypothetical protein IAB68_02585 [Candidatus Aphodocola excrementigallinarum]|uniref:Uncharacterized protein n=1 Tax=Candidatus Aphodocola excrementigallinarum TaxID=2840670 RepID=A0A9D1IN46_9FIRM|nr:hypothetical protein [Candidatus Aphodocola excrementigallinarum]
MLTKEYEQGYISSFAKIFTVLKEEYECLVKQGECENYEIEIKSINNEDIKDYLSICFQKQNGSLIIASSKNINEEITKKVVKDVSLALNESPLASYNFKDLKDYVIYHFSYVKENVLIDNRQILNDLKVKDEIENLNFDINPLTY